MHRVRVWRASSSRATAQRTPAQRLMVKPSDTTELEELRPRMRALALRLLDDDARADDAVQEAFLAAVRTPPIESPTGWMLTVTRRAALRLRREDRDRARRESIVARHEAVRGPDEDLEVGGTVRLLRELVADLGEPYSEVLTLRFYDELGNDDIARRLNIPSATIRTRVRRGLALLRDRLDERHGGDRSAWMSAFVLTFRLEREEVAYTAVGATTATATGLALWLKAVVAVAAALLLGYVGWEFAIGPEDAVPPTADSIADARPQGRPASVMNEASEPVGTGDRTALSSEQPTVGDEPPASPPPPPERATFVTRVTDPSGRALAGMSVERATERYEFESVGVTGPDGRLQFELEPDQGVAFGRNDGDLVVLRARGGSWAQSLHHSLPLRMGTTTETTLAVRPGVPLAGRILKSDGSPWTNVSIVRTVTDGDRRDYDGGAFALEGELRAETDAEGRFSLGRMTPSTHRLELRFQGRRIPLAPLNLEGHESYELEYRVPAEATLVVTAMRADGTVPEAPLFWLGPQRAGPRPRVQKYLFEREFRIEVPPGPARIWVHDGEWIAYYEGDFIAGEERTWDAELEPIAPLRLRFERENGEPYSNIAVQVFSTDELEVDWSRVLLTRTEGRIEIVDVPPGPLDIWIDDIKDGIKLVVPFLTNFEDRSDEHVFVVGPDTFRAVSARAEIDATQKLPPATSFVAFVNRQTRVVPFDAEGRAELGLSPRSYPFYVQSQLRGAFHVGTEELSVSVPAFDFGVVSPPATGRLDVEWTWPDEADVQCRFACFVREQETLMDMAMGPGRPHESYELWPGEYRFLVDFEGRSELDRSLIVQAGETYRVELGPTGRFHAQVRFEATTSTVPARYRVQRVSDLCDEAQYEASLRGEVLAPLPSPVFVLDGQIAPSLGDPIDVVVPLSAGTYAVELDIEGAEPATRLVTVGPTVPLRIW